jgi:hypothetical protein
VHTGQLFFRDALTARVYRNDPYDTRPGPDVTNESDAIYQQGGAQSALLVKRNGSGYPGHHHDGRSAIARCPTGYGSSRPQRDRPAA